MFDITKLNKSSFRGVPFYTQSTDESGGHRLTDHNFINGGTKTEDNGIKNNIFKIVAYIGGDDYLDQKEALKNALNIIGSGTLIEKFNGTLDVMVDTYTIKESIKDFGQATFTITFKLAENEAIEDIQIVYNVDVRNEALANFENDFNNELGEDLINDVSLGITEFWKEVESYIKFLEEDKIAVQKMKDSIGKIISGIKTDILSVTSLTTDISNIWLSFDSVLDLGAFGADPQKSFTNGIKETLLNSATRTFINEAEIIANRQIQTYTNTVIAGITQTSILNLENVTFDTGDDLGSVKNDILTIMELLEEDVIIDSISPISEIIIKQNLLDKYHSSKREFILFYTQKYSGLQNLKDNEIVATVDILNLTMDKYNNIERVEEVLINNDIVDPIFINGNLKLLDR